MREVFDYQTEFSREYKHSNQLLLNTLNPSVVYRLERGITLCYIRCLLI